MSLTSVVIKIGAETASAVSAIHKVDGALGDTQKSGKKFADGISKAAVPAAAALTAIAGAAGLCVHAAAENQQAQSKLEGQLKRSTGASTDAQKATVEHVNAMADAAAVAREDVYPAMSNLVRATGDASKAQGLLTDAMNISAATGKPLGSVSTALGKAYNGSYGALKKLVPTLSDAAQHSKDFHEAQKELNKQFGGAAQDDAKSAAGQYRAMNNSMHELQVTIGDALLPVLQTFLPMITGVLEIAAKHSTVFTVIAGAVAALAGAVLIINGALKVYNALQTVWAARTKIAVIWTNLQTAAQWLLNAALDANPIAIVVIAIAALVAGLILAYKTSGTFRKIVNEAFGAVVSAGKYLAGSVMDFVDALIVAWNHSKIFREIVTGVFGDVKDAIQLVIDIIHRLIDLVGSLIGAIGRIHFPHIPHLPGINMAGAGPAGFGLAPATQAGGIPFNVNVTITGAIDPESTAKAVRNVLERYDRRRGRLPLGPR